MEKKKRRVWCPTENKDCRYCGVEEICEIPNNPCIMGIGSLLEDMYNVSTKDDDNMGNYL